MKHLFITLAYTLAALTIVALLLADYLWLFVASSYSLSWFAGAAYAGGLLALLRHRDTLRPGFANAFVPIAAVALVIASLPFINHDHKAFYRAYRSITPGMTLEAARRHLAMYPLAQRSDDMIWFSYSPKPSTVDFIVLTVRDDHVVNATYSAD